MNRFLSRAPKVWDPMVRAIIILPVVTAIALPQDTVSTSISWEQIHAAVQRTIDESIGKQAPPLSFQDIKDSSSHVLSEFKGQVVLLNFWSRGCAPCIAEMPDLSILQDEYEKAGLRIILLGDDYETQNRFFKHSPVSGTKGQIVNARDQAFLYRFGVLPTLILIDRDGMIRDIWLGAIGYDAMEKRINALIPREAKSFKLHNPRLVLLSTVVLIGLCLIVLAVIWNKRAKKSSKQVH